MSTTQTRNAFPRSFADPTLEADTIELHRALSELVRVYQFRDRDTICCHDVSVTQCYALAALVLRGPLTMNQLAAELYLDKSTASRVIDTLEDKGYVRRTAHPDDGRSLLLAATAAGRRLHGRIEEEILDGEQRLLAYFDHGVRRSMARLIGRLAEAAAARLDTTGGRCCMVD